jgi:predicted regulator of Ras-like GTPase activity (Roadblock/LC7/MglB family)
MLSTFFFPGRLDPVLDGGVGDKDAVVTPAVPTGGFVGQTVLGHQANSQLLDAAGVMALGQGQIGQVDGKVTAAVTAVMFGVANNEVKRMAGARVTQVVQGARGNSVASSAEAAAATTACRIVAASTLDTRLGKILDVCNALGDVGYVFAGTKHGSSSVRNRPPIFILRRLGPDSAHP